MPSGDSYNRLLEENQRVKEENEVMGQQLKTLSEYMTILQDALEALIVEYDDLMLVMGMFGTVDTEDSATKKAALTSAVSVLDETHFASLMEKLDLDLPTLKNVLLPPPTEG
jgi:cell division septum initiation protein DivIVA